MLNALEDYLGRMTKDNVWPAAHTPAGAAEALGQVVDPESLVLRWSSNNRCPHDDALAAWVTLGLITMEQARATVGASAVETREFLAAYRANPPQPDAEQLAEMRAAFGPGAQVVNVITGQAWVV